MTVSTAPTQTPEPGASSAPGLGFLTGVVARGVAAGIVGATVVALWFLIVDSSEGSPLRTPNFLAGSLLGIDGLEMTLGPIMLVARALVRGGVDDAAEEEVSHASECRRPYRGRGQAATSSRIVTTSPSATCSALRTAAFTGTM